MTARHRTETRPATLVVLCSHPIQYYAPLYRSLARRAKIRVKVLFLSDAGAVEHFDTGFGRNVKWDVPLLDGYDHEVLQPQTSITGRTFWNRHDSKLISALNRIRPDWLLLYGYASRMNWVARHWASRHGVRLAYWSDSNIRDPRSRYRTAAKSVLLKHLFFQHLDAVLVTSEANEQYVLSCGAPGSRLRRVPFSIDVRRFERPASSPIGRSRNYDFIWAGRLIPPKRPLDFLAALELLVQRSAVRPRGLMVGDGPFRPDVLAASAALQENGTLEFRGFVNQSQMPGALQSAETLIFTSEIEPFGLAALEGAAAGLALVVADNIGCVGHQDVAREGVNALTFRTRDIGGLAGAMERVMTSPALRLAMQRKSIEIARAYDTERAADVLEAVVLS